MGEKISLICGKPYYIFDPDDAETRKTEELLEDSFQKNPKILDHLYNCDIRLTSKSEEISHSSPLTLITLLNSDPEGLVSALLHEEMHNFLMAMPGDDSFWLLIDELKEIFPDAPRNVENPYVHIVVCLLEYKAMQDIFGRERALAALERQQKYEGVYQIVRDNEYLLTNLIGAFGFLPPNMADD